MLERRQKTRLEHLLKSAPAVVLIGPRQVGKTTLARAVARERASVYLDLESDIDRAKLAHPEAYFTDHELDLVILDEIQRAPEIFRVLRGVIDKGRERGLGTHRFLFLGSASLDLLRQTSESLAGRIAIMELAPFDLQEVGVEHAEKLWVRGGFPESFLATSDGESARWRKDFIRTYLERDIPLLGPRIPAETLRRFWTMLAHAQGGLLNAAALARGLGVSGKTIASYLDLLSDLLLVRRLQPWHENTRKRLVKSPKVYLRDSGLQHALLGIGDKETLLGNPVVGASWEGFVIENVLRFAEKAESYFYRSAVGDEIDLVLVFPGGEKWAFEIKRSLAPSMEKGFHVACNDLKPVKSFVIYPGSERFSIGSGIEAIGVGEVLDVVARA